MWGTLRRQCKTTTDTRRAESRPRRQQRTRSKTRALGPHPQRADGGAASRVADLVELAPAQLARDEHAPRRAPAEREHDGLLLPARDALLAQLDRLLCELEPPLRRACAHEAMTSVHLIGEASCSHRPRLKAGDSTAALKRSNGTRENTWRTVSRPLSVGWLAPSGVVGVAGVVDVLKLTRFGSVMTRKLKTSSRRRCAYGPNTAVRMWWCCSATGVDVPSEDGGVTESTKSSHEGSVSRLIDARHISYA